MKSLPVGMYLPGHSVLHRLDARAKLLCFLLLIAAACCTDSLAGYGIMLLAAGVCIALSKSKLSIALASVLRLIPFFVLIFLMNTCFSDAQTPWVSWWIFRPSASGAMKGVNMVLRVFLALLFSNVLTLTTAPMDLTAAMEAWMHPLAYLRVPTGQIAMIFSVAIGFVPTLFEETDAIRKAQTARGARFDSPNFLERSRATLPLVIPVFLAAFKRADELALAMEARGYRSGVRSRRRRTARLRPQDFLAPLAAALLCAAQIWIF